MSSRRAQLAGLRRVALAALERYPLPAGRLTFVDHGENTTFRHDSAAGRHLVRVHRPQRHGRDVDSTAAIRSEIAWLRAIRDGHRSARPGAAAGRGRGSDRRGVRGRRDPGLLGAALDGRPHPRAVAAPGPPAPARRGDGRAARPGRRAGRRRPTSCASAGTTRRSSVTSWCTATPRPPSAGRSCRRRCGRASEAVAARMADVMPRVGGVGLIHADLHLGNARLPGRRGQADRLRRLRHRSPALRRSPSRSGSCATSRTTRRTGTRCWPATAPTGRSTSRTSTTSSRCGRSRSTSGTPARPRSTRPSPRASTGSTAGRCRCSTWCPGPEPAVVVMAPWRA